MFFMLKFTLRHDLECDPKRFWEVYFDRDFNTKLYAFLGFPEWTLVEQREEPDATVRVARAIPKMEVPGPVAKLLGSSFAYTEEGRFDRAAKTYRFSMKPSTLADKVHNEGVLHVEPRGTDGCTRVVDLTAEAKVFGLGGMIEAATEKNHIVVWGKSVDFFNRWVKEHPIGPAQTLV
jgi:hypothetical protein